MEEKEEQRVGKGHSDKNAHIFPCTFFALWRSPMCTVLSITQIVLKGKHRQNTTK